MRKRMEKGDQNKSYTNESMTEMNLKSTASSVVFPVANVSGPHADDVLAYTSRAVASNDVRGGKVLPPPSHPCGSVPMHACAASLSPSLSFIISSTRPPHPDTDDTPLHLVAKRNECHSERPLSKRICSQQFCTSFSHSFSSPCSRNGGVSEREVKGADALYSSSEPTSSSPISLSFSKGVLTFDGTSDKITTSAAQREDGAAQVKTPALWSTWLVQAPETSDVKNELAVEVMTKKIHRTKSRSESCSTPQKCDGVKDDYTSRRVEMRLPRYRPKIFMSSSLSSSPFVEASSSASVVESTVLSSRAYHPLTTSSLDGKGGNMAIRVTRGMIPRERTPLKKINRASPHLPEEKLSRKNSKERRGPYSINEALFHECVERTSVVNQDSEMALRQTPTKKGPKLENRLSSSSLFRTSHQTFSLSAATPRRASSSSFPSVLREHPKKLDHDVEKKERRSVGTEGELSSRRRQYSSKGRTREEGHHYPQSGGFRCASISEREKMHHTRRNDWCSLRSNSRHRTSSRLIEEARSFSPSSLHLHENTRLNVPLHSTFFLPSPLRVASSAPPIDRVASLLSAPLHGSSERCALSAPRDFRRSKTMGKERRVSLRRCSAPPLNSTPPSTTVVSGSSVKATFHTVSPTVSFAKYRRSAAMAQGHPVLLSSSSQQESSSAAKRFFTLQQLIGEEKAEKEAQRESFLEKVCIQEAQKRKNEKRQVKCCTNKGEGMNIVRKKVVVRNSGACASLITTGTRAESSCGAPPDFLLPFCRFRCDDTAETHDEKVMRNTYWRNQSANLVTNGGEWAVKKVLREETRDEPMKNKVLSHTTEEQRNKRSAVTGVLERSPSPKEHLASECMVGRVSPLSRKTTAHPHSVRDLGVYTSLFCCSERNHSLGMVHSLRKSNSRRVPHDITSDFCYMPSSMSNASCMDNERDGSPSTALTNEVGDDSVGDEEWGVGTREWSLGTTATALFESKQSQDDGT